MDKFKEALQSVSQWDYEVDERQIIDKSGMTISFDGDPLFYAITNLGGRTRVHSGTYSLSTIKKSPGGTFVADPETIISGGSGYAIYMENGQQIGPCVFDGFNIDIKGTAGFVTYAARAPYRVTFRNCVFDGNYDHETNTGPNTKWGAITHGVQPASGFDLFDSCTFINIKREHGIYMHTLIGPLGIVRNCTFSRTGRTGIQHVGRVGESLGPNSEIPGYASGLLKVENCIFEDCGLNDGGSHITIQGISKVWLKGCVSLIGMDEDFKKAYLASHPSTNTFGRGHVVSWSETMGRNGIVDHFAIDDCDFKSADDSGDKEAVELKDVRNVYFMGDATIHSGANHTAVELQSGNYYPDEMVLHTDQLTYADVKGKVTLKGNTIYEG